MAGRDIDSGAVLVEFVGAAGVGKSFLAVRVRDALVQRHLPATDFRKVSIKKFSLRTIVTVSYAAYLAASIRPKTLRAYVFAVKEIAKLQLRWNTSRRGRGIYLCDEGLIHRLRAFTRNSNGLCMKEIADRLARHVVTGHIVVVVEAGVEKILARRSERRRRGDKFSNESVAADVRLLQDSIATIIHLQQSSQRDIRLIRVNVEGDGCETLAGDIADAAEAAWFKVAATMQISSR